MREPASPGAQLVIADHAPRRELLDRAADRRDLFGRQRLVDEHPGGAEQEPDSGVHDQRGDRKGDRRIEPLRAGQLDQGERHQHPRGGQRIGSQVGGVALQRRRLGPPRGAADLRRDDQVDHDRERHHADPQPDRGHASVAQQAPDRLKRNHRRAHQDQDPLERRGQVLEPLVPVAVALVGGFAGLADGEEGDDRSHQIDARMHRLGQQRDRAGDRAGDHLEQDQRGVRDDRERGRSLLDARDRSSARLGRASSVRHLGRVSSVRHLGQLSSARHLSRASSSKPAAPRRDD